MAEVRRRQQAGRVVAMVGDGIGDGLAQADVGVALGGGTDVAVEASDLTVVGGDPNGVADAIALSPGDVRHHQAEPVLGLRLQRGRHPSGRRRPCRWWPRPPAEPVQRVRGRLLAAAARLRPGPAGGHPGPPPGLAGVAVLALAAGWPSLPRLTQPAADHPSPPSTPSTRSSHDHRGPSRSRTSPCHCQRTIESALGRLPGVELPPSTWPPGPSRSPTTSGPSPRPPSATPWPTRATRSPGSRSGRDLRRASPHVCAFGDRGRRPGRLRHPAYSGLSPVL